MFARRTGKFETDLPKFPIHGISKPIEISMTPMIFSAGDELEVKRSGAWIPASVLCSTGNPGDNLMISYFNDCDHRVVVLASASAVRPPPPLKNREFEIGELIEVFQACKCWRRGRFLGFCGESRCSVLIDGEAMAVNVDCEDTRPCLDWIDGSWISPSCAKKGESEAESENKQIKLKIKFSGLPMESRFSAGNKVEVRTDENGYEGARYTAKILGSFSKNRFLVEYDTLKTDDETGLLQEVVKEENLRPCPPETVKIYRYKIGQAVDVWYNEGWWQGVISKVIDSLTYIVYFATTNEEMIYQRSCLRLHQDWVHDKWVAPLLTKSGSKLGATATIKKRMYRRKKTSAEFRKGKAVEVKSNEEGFMGAWYSAVIVEPKEKSKFLVEYKTLRTDDDSEFLKEVVDLKDIRPCPTQTKAQFYEPLQKVDVWYNDGWWEGVVCQVLGGLKYGVYFRSTDEEMEFERSFLRLHKDWINGKWSIPSKDHTILQRRHVASWN